MTRVFSASGAFGLALLAAAIDTGRIGDGRRVLLMANEADTPEVVPDLRAAAGFAALAARFDEVVSWNELIAPLHPSAWRPPNREVPVLGRLLAGRLAPDDSITELVVESVTEGPGRTLAALVPDVPITLAVPSFAVYAPPLVAASNEIGARITRLLQVDLVPAERGLAARPPHAGVEVEVDTVPVDSLRGALAAFATCSATPDAVLLGGRHAESGLLSPAEERELRLDTVRALAAGGHRRLVFAPHPVAGIEDHRALVEAARLSGAELTVAAAGQPHETWAGTAALVVGTCSPVLFLARRAATSGCRTLLQRPVRYGHPDRLPLALADALLPRLDPDGHLSRPATLDIAHLVDAVSFCLAPAFVPELRPRAVAWVEGHGAPPYLQQARLSALGLPVSAIEPASEPPASVPRWISRARTWAGSRASRAVG